MMAGLKEGLLLKIGLVLKESNVPRHIHLARRGIIRAIPFLPRWVSKENTHNRPW